ncbi:MAG: undecaprenyl-phosphate glucose phosphotransferase, partial [Flavobacteriaceae bacterium]|nr:undecaprenyl-phosphate glucose phosphotransferase [Flavobacteriaceae bacterium]
MMLLKLLATYRFSRYYKVGFLVWDVVLLNTAIALSFFFQYGYFQFLDIKEVRAVSLLSNIFWITLLLYKDSFRIIRTERIETILYRTIRMLMIHMSIIALFILVLKYDAISRLRMIYFYSTFFLLLISFRIFFMKILKYIRTQGYNFR